MKWLHVLGYPPLHKLKRELGRMWLEIGSAASALNMFEQLDMWEDIVKAYLIMKETKKALSIVQEQLKVNKTPLFLCILGDITDEKEHYEEAWKISGNRFVRAQRSLGNIAMRKQQVSTFNFSKYFKFKEAIEHFEKALNLNPQYSASWFRMGCCAMVNEFLTLIKICIRR